MNRTSDTDYGPEDARYEADGTYAVPTLMPKEKPEEPEPEIELFVKVCEVCGRQVEPHVDHHLGASRWVSCSHGRTGRGVMEQVGWKRIKVVPA